MTMAVRDLVPWIRRSRVPVTRIENTNPLVAFHQEMNRLFDDFWRDFNGESFGWSSSFDCPRVEMSETDKEVKVEAELPGMDEDGVGRRVSDFPRVEMSETDKEFKVEAELPGMDEDDVELLVSDDVLTIRGEKKSEREDKGRRVSERFYGRFERQIPLPIDVDQDKVSASFKK